MTKRKLLSSAKEDQERVSEPIKPQEMLKKSTFANPNLKKYVPAYLKTLQH